MYKTVVDDDQLTKFGKSLDEYCVTLKSATEYYRLIINHILSEGIMEGNTHNYLIQYADLAKQLGTIIDGVRDKTSGIIAEYIAAIEEADSYLYDASILKQRRDYTQKLYDALQLFLEHFDHEIGNAFSSWLDGVLGDFFDFVAGSNDAGFYKRAIQKDYGRLLAYNRETSLGLKNLFDNVHLVDERYGASMSSTVALLGEIAAFIRNMGNTLDPSGNGTISPEAVQNLTTAMDVLTEQFERYSKGQKITDPPTTEDVRKYIEKDAQNPCPGFEKCPDTKTEFYEEYAGPSVWTTAAIAFFDWYGINKDVLTNELKNMLGEELTFPEYLELLQMTATLDSLNEKETQGQKISKETSEVFEEIKKALGMQETTLENFEKLLKNLKHKDGTPFGKTAEGKRFNSFIDKIGGYKKIFEFGAKGAEYLEALFADYSYQQDIIDSMAQNAGDSPSAMRTVRRLQKLYENQWTVIIDKAIGDGFELGYDATIGTITTLLPAMGVVTGTIDILGEASGLGARYKAAYQAMQLDEAAQTSHNMYVNAVKAFRDADPNDPNYDKLAKNVQNMFELYRQNLENMYTKMAESFSGTKRSYYQYCAMQMQQMDMKSPAPPLMTYTEYCSQDLGTGDYEDDERQGKSGRGRYG